METNENIYTPRPRPCIVQGSRAIWHRWRDSARPKHGSRLETDENADYFQVWNVHAIVEFEDGTVARVWPSNVQFVDGGAFADFEWPETEEELPWTPEESKALPPNALGTAGLGYNKRRFMCPNCGKQVGVYTYGPKWAENGLSEEERIDCSHCGQEIDWSGVPLPGEHVEE